MSRFSQILEFLKNSPEDPFLIFALAKEYEKMEKWDEAISQYQVLLESHPRYIGTYYHYGSLHKLLGNNTEALDIFNRGINIATDMKEYHALGELNQIKLATENE